MTPDRDNLADSPSVNDVEEESESEVAIAHPFDPAKIDVDLKTLTLDLLIRRMRHDEIDLSPAFQRNVVWSSKDQSRLIRLYAK